MINKMIFDILDKVSKVQTTVENIEQRLLKNSEPEQNEPIESQFMELAKKLDFHYNMLKDWDRLTDAAKGQHKTLFFLVKRQLKDMVASMEQSVKSIAK